MQGNPQPLDTKLLQKVLAQGYYSVFYPGNRDNLNVTEPNNPWAVTCSYCEGCPLGTVASVVPPTTTAMATSTGLGNRKLRQ